jgi:GxxExxY protein
MAFDELSNLVIGASIKVHSVLGPGLYENVYKNCLQYELSKIGCKVLAEVPFPIKYENVQLAVGYRIDLLVNDILILEIKSIEQTLNIHKAQIFTYLKLTNLSVGLILNFNKQNMANGISRIVNTRSLKNS